MPSSKNQTVLHWARKTKGFYLITVHKFLQILYVIFSSVLQACDSTSGCVPGCSQLISASFAMFFFSSCISWNFGDGNMLRNVKCLLRYHFPL